MFEPFLNRISEKTVTMICLHSSLKDRLKHAPFRVSTLRYLLIGLSSSLDVVKTLDIGPSEGKGMEGNINSSSTVYMQHDCAYDSGYLRRTHL